ncbi:MAG TPA: hypothetical protein VMT76_04090 [Puia sp.]|nr:hypothetical protein [Puia sp.]
MSEMEPEIKSFFKKLAISVYIGLFWLMLAMTFGIYFGFMFTKDKISVGNILYYSLLVTSFIFLMKFYIRTWKKKFPHE